MRAIAVKRRPWRLAAVVFASAIGLAVLAAAAIMVRLAWAPVVVEALSDRLATALTERLGPSWSASVDSTSVEQVGLVPSVKLSNVEIRNPAGLTVLRAPQAIVAIDPASLIGGRIAPRSIAFSGLDLKVALTDDGSLALSAGGETGGAAAAEPAPIDPGQRDPAAKPASALAVAAASFVELLTTTEGRFGALDRIGIEGARLTLVDQAGRERFKFEDVSLSFARPDDGLGRFTFGARGGVGRWELEGTVAGRSGGERTAAITVRDVPISDLLALAGKAGGIATSDMPLSGTIRVAISPEGRLGALDVDIKGASSVVLTNDPDMPSVDVDSAALRTSWDAAAGAVSIDALDLASGATRLALTGRLAPGSGGEPWRLTLAGREAAVAAFEAEEGPVAVDRLEAEISGVAGGGIAIDRFSASGPAFGVSISGSLGTASDEGGLSLAVTASRSEVRPALALWPAFAAKPVRDYLRRNLRGGVVERLSLRVALTDAELKATQQRKPVPDRAVKAEFVLSKAKFRLPDGLPRISGAEASGTTTGRSASVTIAKASAGLPGGRALTIGNGSFVVADASRPRPSASVTFKLGGGADALVALLGAEAVRRILPIEIDPASVKGAADLRVALTLPLAPDVVMSEVETTAQGSLTGLGLDGLFGKDRLEGAHLALSLDRALLSLKGEGRIGGLPATIDVRQPLHAGPGEAVVALVFDEAARVHRGLSFGRQLTGPVSVKVTAPLARTERKAPRVEIDLAKAQVDGLLPGWSKAAGKPGRIAFALTDRAGGGHSLDDFVLESGGVFARGSLDTAADGSLDSAKLSALKLAPGDDMRLDLDRGGGTYRAVVRGAVVDARPFLKALNVGAEAKAVKDKENRDFDLDLSANILAGYNDEALTNATLKLSHRGKEIRQMQLAGRFGRASVSAQLVQRDKPALVIQSTDAGALLRFMDLYRRMRGGDLNLQLTPGDTYQVGALTIRDFALKNEPALRRIVAQQPPTTTGSGDRAIQAPPPIDVDDVAFTRLQASFTRSAGRLDLKESIIWGPQIGLKLDGSVDFGRDRADLTGTYVPAYSLNNAFSKVPLFGPLLGGGSDEGLIAVNFRVTGPASAPTVTINPLSAVAPGILRKFLEAFTLDPSRLIPAAPVER